jgi:DNA polymerase-3 subunit epsilon
MKLKIVRPLVFFDLETTGVNIATDRIVELSYHKIFPNGNSESKTYRVKPVMLQLGEEVQMPIPAEATAVHGITDEDVRDCPTFKQIAQEVADTLAGCDLAGYNSSHFDLPLLAEEFARTNVDIDLKRMLRRTTDSRGLL